MTWPSVPAALPGDSLSGFVARTSALLGVRADDLLADAGWVPTAETKDLGTLIDLTTPDAERAQQLCSATGIPANLLSSMTAQPFIGGAVNLPGLTSASAHREWINGYKRAFRTVKWVHMGPTACCPACLLERPNVHRIVWRIGTLGSCSRHQLTLVSQCPDCGQPPFEPWGGLSQRPGPWIRNVGSRGCRCGWSARDLAPLQRPLTEMETTAATTAQTWAHAGNQANRWRELQLWISAILQHGLDTGRPVWGPVTKSQGQALRRHGRGKGGRTQTHTCPDAELLTTVMPWAIELTQQCRPVSGRTHSLPNVKRITAAQERTVDRDVDPVALAAHVATGSIQRRALSVTRAPVISPLTDTDYVPALWPKDLLPARMADLIHDAYAADPRPATRIAHGIDYVGVRGAVSVWVAHRAWHRGPQVVTPRIGAPDRAGLMVASIRRGACVLDTIDALEAEIADAARALTASTTNYRQRQVHLPADPTWIKHMSQRGISELAARVWLTEDYACMPFKWTLRRTARQEIDTELASCRNLFTDRDIRDLDDRARHLVA